MKMDTPNWIRYFVLCGLILSNHSICKFRIYTIPPFEPTFARLESIIELWCECFCARMHRKSFMFCIEMNVGHLLRARAWNGRIWENVREKSYTSNSHSHTTVIHCIINLTPNWRTNFCCSQWIIDHAIAWSKSVNRLLTRCAVHAIPLRSRAHQRYFYFFREWKTEQSYGNNVDVGSPSFLFISDAI